MKFFVDTADTDAIRELAATGLVDGVTTNPSLINKSGRDIIEVTKEICGIVDGPVSAEVVAMRSQTAAEPARHDFRSLPSLETDTIEGDLRVTLDRLGSVGIEEVVAFDLTNPALKIPVAWVVVPGLEHTVHRDPCYRPGERARRAAEEPS